MRRRITDATEDRHRAGALFPGDHRFAVAPSSHSLMRWRIATASARCSLVITALLVSQFSAASESCAAKALRITDDVIGRNPRA